MTIGEVLVTMVVAISEWLPGLCYSRITLICVSPRFKIIGLTQNSEQTQTTFQY